MFVCLVIDSGMSDSKIDIKIHFNSIEMQMVRVVIIQCFFAFSSLFSTLFVVVVVVVVFSRRRLLLLLCRCSVVAL